MKRRSLFPFLGLILILLTISISVTAQQTPFEYDSDKIEPGTMYVYQFSTNPDKFEAKQTKKVYFKHSNKKYLEIESLRSKNKDPEYADYTTYKLNWNYMMLESFSYQFLGPKEISFGHSWQANARTDFQEQKQQLTNVKLTKGGKEVKKYTKKFDHFPTFFYITLHVDAWTTMRFYPYPKEKITAWNYTGNKLTQVKIKHQGEEIIEVPKGKLRTHKFKITGKGVLAWLFGKKAWLWLSAEDERNYMVKYVNNNDRGNKPRVEFRLSEVKKVSEKEWRKKVDRWG